MHAEEAFTDFNVIGNGRLEGGKAPVDHLSEDLYSVILNIGSSKVVHLGHAVEQNGIIVST